MFSCIWPYKVTGTSVTYLLFKRPTDRQTDRRFTLSEQVQVVCANKALFEARAGDLATGAGHKVLLPLRWSPPAYSRHGNLLLYCYGS
jgi:hypothetical protein